MKTTDENFCSMIRPFLIFQDRLENNESIYITTISFYKNEKDQ